MMENKDWLGFDSFETETKMKALQCKTLAEIMALYRNNPSAVNISKPATLSPTIGADKTLISEYNLVGGIFDTMRENSADGSQNTNYLNVTKQRVCRNGITNSMTNNTLMVH